MSPNFHVLYPLFNINNEEKRKKRDEFLEHLPRGGSLY